MQSERVTAEIDSALQIQGAICLNGLRTDQVERNVDRISARRLIVDASCERNAAARDRET